ncbi:MAG: trigger factor [Planctomycetaceae bacterium]
MSSDAEGVLTETEESANRMDLKVEIRNVGPCKKHVSVTVQEADINTIREDCVGELSDRAQVPGFRTGRVPRQLLVKKFKDEISAQIKQKVLLASLEQMSEEHNLDPISEPNIDVESLEIPDAGDFSYEFEVEVRPEFDLPDYASFTIRRPSGDVTDEELATYREQFLSSYAKAEVVEEPVVAGDVIVCSMTFEHGGNLLREVKGTSVEVLPSVNFQDAALDGFDKLMEGAKAGDTRNATVTISLQSPVVEMRGEQVDLKIEVEEVRRRQPVVIDREFLENLSIESEEDLVAELRSSLQRQVEFQQRQTTREQVLEKIVDAADWDLPESLVRQQTENALRRELLEMAQAGFTREHILARENELRRNALDTTRQALKEHFVLDRIATQENIECEPGDIDRELLMMSFQSGEPVRRIRARLAKNGMIENLEAQLRERKAVDFILSKATFEDVEREPVVQNNAAGLRFAICGQMNPSLIDDTDETEE